MERSIRIDSADTMTELYGALDVNIRKLEECFGVCCVSREDGESGKTALVLSCEDGTALARAADAVEYLKGIADARGAITPQMLEYVCAMFKDGRAQSSASSKETVFASPSRESR